MRSKVQGVAVVIERDGKFLLGKRSAHKRAAPHYWCPITGRIEPGETEPQAVIREVSEEIGIEVRPLRKLCNFDTNDKSAELHWWLAEIVTGIPHLANDEHSELAWVSPQEMNQLSPIFREDVEVFERFVRNEL